MSFQARDEALPSRVRVAIVGGGFSGIGMAIELLRRGIRDFVLLEKASELGGTWRDNEYPGCACDVPSALYSFSFAPRPSWSRIFAPQAEIQRYQLDVARDHGVLPFVRTEAEVTASRWDDAAALWRLSTARGPLAASFVVFGGGPLSEPRLPDLPGMDRFRGEAFHTARWRHDLDLTGRRVAVIGTGSSAIQLVPEIQPKVDRLFVFQRTPAWVLPKPDTVVPDGWQQAFARAPLLQRALRGAIYGATELLQLAQRKPAVMDEISRLGLWHLERQVPDPTLRAQLRPSFSLGCKRLLLSNTWYPALLAPNATLVPHAVREITETGVIGADGVHREVDTLVFGTGFRTADASRFATVFGRDGRSLEATWAGSPQAYLGTTCHGFPNAFLMLGPNLGNGHGSALVLIEAQARYAADAIDLAMRRDVASLEPRPGSQRVWNEDVQAALATMVWNAGGCASWYLDRNGRNSAIYPWSTIDLRRRLSRFDPAPYTLRLARPSAQRAPDPDLARIELRGAVVVVTGGARGIGLATAERLADRGALVVIADRDEQELGWALARLGPLARGFPVDVSDRASFERLVRRVEDEVGPIDVLVNNAGILPSGRFLDEADAASDATLRVNVGGVSLGMKLVLPGMIERGRGHVVNVASLAGKLAIPFMATYVASKHAVVGLSGAVRRELDGTGVTVSAVLPGVVRTRLAAGIETGDLGAIEPDQVARAIVDSCRTRAAEIVVPLRFSFAPAAALLAPTRAVDAVFRALRPDRVLAPDAVHARRGYERSIGAERSPPATRSASAGPAAGAGPLADPPGAPQLSEVAP